MPPDLWPYLIVVVAGFLPNEVFRLTAVFLSRGVDEGSEVFAWIRIVATCLLAAVVSKLIYAPAASLATVPLAIRVCAIAIGVTAFFVLRRSLVLGILAGEAAFVTAAFWFGRS